MCCRYVRLARLFARISTPLSRLIKNSCLSVDFDPLNPTIASTFFLSFYSSSASFYLAHSHNLLHNALRQDTR